MEIQADLEKWVLLAHKDAPAPMVAQEKREPMAANLLVAQDPRDSADPKEIQDHKALLARTHLKALLAPLDHMEDLDHKGQRESTDHQEAKEDSADLVATQSTATALPEVSMVEEVVAEEEPTLTTKSKSRSNNCDIDTLNILLSCSQGANKFGCKKLFRQNCYT